MFANSISVTGDAFSFMCKDNQYGCHATAAAGGIVWTGVVTDLGVTPATEEPVTRTPSTKEGVEAWGIKFLSVRWLEFQQPWRFTHSLTPSICRSHQGQLPPASLPQVKTRATLTAREHHLRIVHRVPVAYPEAQLLASLSEALLVLRS